MKPRSLVTRWFTFLQRDTAGDAENRHYFEDFLAEGPNAWIRENRRVERALRHFFTTFPTITLNRLRKRKLYFVPCSGHMSATITYDEGTSVVLLFPEILRALESTDPSEALAILAHELGHVVHDHAARGTPQLQAQVEADAFACSLGFAREICALLSREASEEGRVRLGVIHKEIDFEQAA